jgi:hypothetical protein
VLYGTDGRRLDAGRIVNLWEADAASGRATSIVAPLDPKEFGIDPLMLM